MVIDDIVTNFERAHSFIPDDGKKAGNKKFQGMDIASIPDEIIVKFLANLGTKDISVCMRVNRRWRQLIDEYHIQSHVFCRRYYPWVRSLGAQKAAASYDLSIRHWLTCFSNKGKELVKQLDTLLDHGHFHEILFFSIARLLASSRPKTHRAIIM